MLGKNAAAAFVLGLHLQTIIVNSIPEYTLSEISEGHNLSRHSVYSFHSAVSWSKKFCNWEVDLPKMRRSNFENKIFGVATVPLIHLINSFPFAKVYEWQDLEGM